MSIPQREHIPIPQLYPAETISAELPTGVAPGDVLASAPAKLNLFLHITGQRANGYHELQTVFRFVDLQDTLAFRVLPQNELQLTSSFDDVAPEQNLILRAASALQSETGCRQGCHITLDKVIPTGAGLGGGSSNAATTLVVLNHLWQTGLTLEQLLSLAARLGADVPVFVAGCACWAEGIGDVLQGIELPSSTYVVLYPGVHVDTRAMFETPELTRNCSAITIRDFRNGVGKNVFEPVVFDRYPPVASASAIMQTSIERAQKLHPFDQAGGGAAVSDVRMTGSGSTLFAGCQDADLASRLYDSVEAGLAGNPSLTRTELFLAAGLDRSPLYQGVGHVSSHDTVGT